MKRCKQRLGGLLMALGLAAALLSMADEVVAHATGGWFAVDSREVKDTTLSGGAVVGGATNVVLQSSPNAWGETGGGASATITWASAACGGTVAEATTASEVAWTPTARAGVDTLTYLSGSVQKTAQFLVSVQVGDSAVATVRNGVCTVTGTGDMASYEDPTDSVLWSSRGDFTRVVIGDGVTGIGKNAFAYMKGVRDVTIGDGVASIGENAFFHCSYVTNLVVGANVASVGANAFDRNFSLQSVAFGSKAAALACQDAYRIVARITMDGDQPTIDAVPDVAVEGYTKTLKGKEELSDAEWQDVPTPIPANFRFFRYEYEPKQ